MSKILKFPNLNTKKIQKCSILFFWEHGQYLGPKLQQIDHWSQNLCQNPDHHSTCQILQLDARWFEQQNTTCSKYQILTKQSFAPFRSPKNQKSFIWYNTSRTFPSRTSEQRKSTNRELTGGYKTCKVYEMLLLDDGEWWEINTVETKAHTPIVPVQSTNQCFLCCQQPPWRPRCFALPDGRMSLPIQ